MMLKLGGKNAISMICKAISGFLLLAGMILSGLSCSLSAPELAEDDAKKVAAAYTGQFLFLYAKADSINSQILQRLSYTEQDGQAAIPDVKEIISGQEATYIWGKLMEDPNILQAIIHLGRTNGLGVNLVLHPEKDFSTDGLGFKTEVEGIELSGIYGSATELNGEGQTCSLVRIENAATRSTDGGFLQVVLLINADYVLANNTLSSSN